MIHFKVKSNSKETRDIRQIFLNFKKDGPKKIGAESWEILRQLRNYKLLTASIP